MEILVKGLFVILRRVGLIALLNQRSRRLPNSEARKEKESDHLQPQSGDWNIA